MNFPPESSAFPELAPTPRSELIRMLKPEAYTFLLANIGSDPDPYSAFCEAHLLGSSLAGMPLVSDIWHDSDQLEQFRCNAEIVRTRLEQSDKLFTPSRLPIHVTLLNKAQLRYVVERGPNKSSSKMARFAFNLAEVQVGWSLALNNASAHAAVHAPLRELIDAACAHG